MRYAKGLTSKKNGGIMLEPQKEAEFEQGIHQENFVINIVPDRRYQTVLGFGGAFTETSAYNFSKMSDTSKKKIIEAYFDKDKGLGYNFCRTHIHSCDFSLSRYTYVEENDEELATFSIDRDHEYIIPFIRAAQDAAEDLWLFASPWSPPAWMKSNNDICHGGRLLEKYYGTWAEYMAKYAGEYQKAGIPLFGMSVQNEAAAWQTWESCLYTAREEAVFVHEHLRPALNRAGFPDLNIMIWDHNKERVYERMRDSFSVPGAAEDIWGVAFHWYSGDHFEGLDMAREAFPDKPLVLSEFCVGGMRKGEIIGPHSNWNSVELYAHEMIGNFNHHMAASVDWNMVVDEEGGPYHDREGGCKAQIVVDPASDTVSIEPVYYCVAHFSKFIRRGAVRVGSSSFSEDVKAAAFENPDGELVLVVLSRARKTQEVFLRLDGGTAKVKLPAHSLTTFVIPPETEE